MGIRVGICGTGAFADCFIPLFKAHPEVREVVLCDLDAAKLRAKAKQHGLAKTCPSLDELCQADVDAIAIFSQNWKHGPQAVQALRAGKHVYSAVPSAISMDEIRDLVSTVEATGLIYMVGETSYYYPTAICGRRCHVKARISAYWTTVASSAPRTSRRGTGSSARSGTSRTAARRRRPYQRTTACC